MACRTCAHGDFRSGSELDADEIFADGATIAGITCNGLDKAAADKKSLSPEASFTLTMVLETRRVMKIQKARK